MVLVIEKRPSPPPSSSLSPGATLLSWETFRSGLRSLVAKPGGVFKWLHPRGVVTALQGWALFPGPTGFSPRRAGKSGCGCGSSGTIGARDLGGGCATTYLLTTLFCIQSRRLRGAAAFRAHHQDAGPLYRGPVGHLPAFNAHYRCGPAPAVWGGRYYRAAKAQIGTLAFFGQSGRANSLDVRKA